MIQKGESMITKERLEELIEQGATIYSNEYGEIQLIKENDLSLYENGQNNYILYALEPNKKYHNEIFDEDLFETEEEAKWFAEFGCIERTERLELPTWEEIQKRFENNNKFGGHLIVEFDDVQFMVFIGNYSKKFIKLTNQPRKSLTKENYLKACEKCRKLFLREEEV